MPIIIIDFVKFYWKLKRFADRDQAGLRQFGKAKRWLRLILSLGEDRDSIARILVVIHLQEMDSHEKGDAGFWDQTGSH